MGRRSPVECETVMNSSVSVHVIASSSTGLVLALDMRLGDLARVRHHVELPCRPMLGATDLLVIDLDNLPASLDPSALIPLLSRIRLWLVSGERPVAARWLDVAR